MKRNIRLLFILLAGLTAGKLSAQTTETDTGSAGTYPPDTSGSEPVSFAEVMPEFPGGDIKMQEFIGTNLTYPRYAKENGMEGRVVVTFVVETDGSISDIKLVKDPGYGMGDEVVRVIKLMPRWKPGMHNGKAVRVKFVIPINFDIADEPEKKKKKKRSN